MVCKVEDCIEEICSQTRALGFNDGINDDAIRFPRNFEGHLKDIISNRADVYGVYLIYGKKDDQEKDCLLYIGKSGTISQDGIISDQKIRKRLLNVREKNDGKKIRGDEYFRKVLDGINGPGVWDELRIKWIETYRKQEGVAPFLAEARLLAAYFVENRKLPPLNKKA